MFAGVGGALIGCGSGGGGGTAGTEKQVIRSHHEGDLRSHHEGDVTVTADGVSLQCPVSTACFDVDAPKHNITHLFVKVGFDGCPRAPFTISVDGHTVPASRLHTRGGPCNAQGQQGEDFVDRDVWFPLVGNQQHARVCVTVDGRPALVSVGAKAAEECAAASVTGTCGCPPPDLSSPPDLPIPF